MEIALRTEVTPALITANFDEVRKRLEGELQRFDVVVTADTLSDCKKLATELNKLKGEIDTRRKEEVSKASEPVRQFDEKMKALVSMCKEGRQNLIDQIARFDAEQIKKAQVLAADYLALQIDNAGLSPEFSDIKLPMQKISNLTKSGNLTSAARQEIDDLISDKSLLQSRTGKRLTDLELECRRKGMDEPLERAHVDAFLMADDDVYQSRLDSMIESELARIERIKQAEQAKAEQAARQAEEAAKKREADAVAKAEADARANIAAEKLQQVENEEAETIDQPIEPTKEAVPSGEVTISATFKVNPPAGVPHERILAAFIKRLKENGFEKSFFDAEVI